MKLPYQFSLLTLVLGFYQLIDASNQTVENATGVLEVDNTFQCYGCDYNITDPDTYGCKDPFDSSNMETEICSPPMHCKKGSAVIGGDHGKLTIGVERLCTNDCFTGCVTLAASDGYLELCAYCCQDDLCNTGGTVIRDLLTILVANLISILVVINWP